MPVTPVTSHYRPPAAMPRYVPKPAHWPSGSGSAALAGGSTLVRAGSLPVWVGAAGTAPASTAVRVAASGPDAARAAGVTGLLLAATRDKAGPGTVRLQIDYRPFEDAYGGDWASRLRLVALPPCALTTPQRPACRVQTPLTSVNDVHAGAVRGDVALPAGGPAVIAAAAAPSGSGGDFSATSLQPEGSWQAGGSSGGFAWSYPVDVPSVPGGLQPSVTLAYSSQAQDGLTSATNTQASWVGDGWDYGPGFIERSYRSCHQNPDGPTKTTDYCWSADNVLSISLNGSSSTLVFDDRTKTYHPQSDANEKVELLTDATEANGAYNGEHWRVTTADGTQYNFGLDHLPGFTTGSTRTNSAWTEPVYSTASGQPCFNATFSNSFCPDMAYRWNLDYVVDTHSDAVSYFYQAKTGTYAPGTATKATAASAYTRTGYLQKIQYGQRAGAVYSSTPAAQVNFTVAGRCDNPPPGKLGCDPATLTSATAVHWPDVPFDLNCTANADCSVHSPTFWSEFELTGIDTQALVGSTPAPVDSFTLTHTFPATGDVTKPALWLGSITRTGRDTSAGGTDPTTGAPSAQPITQPPTSFVGTPMSNRVNLGNGQAPITRQRMFTITTAAGAKVTVNYSAAPCWTCIPASPQDNTSLAYPAYWIPPGAKDPQLDWFNKYIVTGVTQDDPTGGAANDTISTTYTPVGDPAWHQDDNPLTAPELRTWNQWRGYGGMIVHTGTAPDPVTKAVYVYFRGMGHAVTDLRGDPAVTDAEQYAGMTYESRSYDGSTVISDQVGTPWSSAPTASQARAGLPTLQAFHLGVSDAASYHPLAGGGTRTVRTTYTHDELGRVTTANDLGDTGTDADDLCTTSTYSDNTAARILTAVTHITAVARACGARATLPDDAVDDTRTYYDSATADDTAPTKGDVTMIKKVTSYDGTTPVYTTTSTTQVDQYGRPTTVIDALGQPTSTAYTPATGAAPTGMTVTDPMQLVTRTGFDPLRGSTVKLTDPAGYVTTEQYDALGRLTAVWKPGRPSTESPTLKYAYDMRNSAPSVVTASVLNEDATSYRVATTLYDSLLRVREVQTQTLDNQRTITDTVYNSDGWQSVHTDPYPVGGMPSGTLVQAQPGQVPSQVAYRYDGAGRKTDDIAYRPDPTTGLATETWRSTYTYNGADVTTTTPPAGLPPSSTFRDARGRITALLQYHAGVTPDPVHATPADYDRTSYGYNAAGQRASMTDQAGTTWAWKYDLAGNQIETDDPDAGRTLRSYDAAGKLITRTDVRGRQITHGYDKDWREIGTWDTSTDKTRSATNRLTTRTYDSVKPGLPATVSSVSGGDTFTTSVEGYGPFGTPTQVRTTLTGTDAALVPAAGFVTGYGYSAIGTPNRTTVPEGGGLSQETTTTGLDNFGQPTSVGVPGQWTAVSAVGYDPLGRPLRFTMPTGVGDMFYDLTYDQQTNAITDAQVTGNAGVLDHRSYRYGGGGVSPGSGLLTSTVDNQTGGVVDTQCYGYDYLARLKQAWTATDNCAAAASKATAGGPATPYWQSWTYDASGNRATQTDHGIGAGSADTTTTFSYPLPGVDATQPHTLSGTTATGPAAAAHTGTYGYDPAGDVTTIHSGGPTGDQTLTWGVTGKLATDTTPAGQTGFVYDADGNLVVRRDPGRTTFYYGTEQLVRDNNTGSVSGTRYYDIGGLTIAARSSDHATVRLLIPDFQGTAQLTVDTADQAIVRRAYLPFGGPRGAAPTAWPGDRGYTTGTEDPATALTNLGAREYDPSTGRFLSPDPVLDDGDPASLNGYDLADNSPVTKSDPTGLSTACVDGPGSACAGGGGTTSEEKPWKPSSGPAETFAPQTGGSNATHDFVVGDFGGRVLPAYLRSIGFDYEKITLDLGGDKTNIIWGKDGTVVGTPDVILWTKTAIYIWEVKRDNKAGLNQGNRAMNKYLAALGTYLVVNGHHYKVERGFWVPPTPTIPEATPRFDGKHVIVHRSVGGTMADGSPGPDRFNRPGGLRVYSVFEDDEDQPQEQPQSHAPAGCVSLGESVPTCPPGYYGGVPGNYGSGLGSLWHGLIWLGRQIGKGARKIPEIPEIPVGPIEVPVPVPA